MTEKAILFDSTTCMACRACQVACKQWWELPGVATTNHGTYENPSDLSPETWNRIRFNEIEKNGTVRWLFTRQSCMHCTDATCVWVCPSYARSYSPQGYVVIDPERCIGCARCLAYCPMGIPRIGSEKVSPRITVQLGGSRVISYKCEFCKDRVENGLIPSCVKTCPPGALQFGDRTELIERGRAKVKDLQATYPQARLYGETELGGLHVMYILTEAAGIHGLPESPQFGTYARYDEKSYPDWYNQAVADGKLASFPVSARPEWYLQRSDIVSPSTPVTQTVPVSPSVTVTPTSTIPALPEPEPPKIGWGGGQWSLLGIGVIGAGSAIWWAIQRRLAQQQKK